jgi:hypothetical protein
MKTSRIAIYLALILVLTVGGVAGCIRSEPEIFVSRGEILIIVISKIQVVDKVFYAKPKEDSEEVQTFVITPQEEGTTLALAQARVVNQKSTRVTLTLDKEAVLLEIGSEIFNPLYFAEHSEPTTELIPEEYSYTPLLWGNVHIKKGFEVTGWFIFEVPVDSDFTNFYWEDVESIRVPLSN